MEEEVNRYRTLVGAYYGVLSIDEYELKAYVLKDIKRLITSYEKDSFDYKKESLDVRDRVSLRVKWHDAVNILNEINADKELIHIIRMRIKKDEKGN